MNNKNFLVAAVALLFTLGSCKKETTPSSISKTKTELLTQSGWKLTSVMTSTNGAPAVEGISSYLPCELDNITTFSTNSVYAEIEGLTKCDPIDADTVNTGTWALATNETYLNVTEASLGYTASLKMITLDATTLKLENYDSLSATSYMFTWKH